jgi:hypothetical protein
MHHILSRIFPQVADMENYRIQQEETGNQETDYAAL